MTTPSLNFLTEADNACKNGDYQLAEELYRELLALSPNSIEILHKLSFLYMSSGNSVEAITILTNAINLEPNNPYNYYNLGLAYQQDNEPHLAINYYTAALAIEPNLTLALNNMGIALQHIGKIESANKYFREAIYQDPNCFDAYFNYAQSHKFTKDDKQTIETLEKKLESSAIPETERIKIHFTLGKAYDDLNEYSAAFRHYKLGNTEKKCQFDMDRYTLYIDKLINTFDLALIRKLETGVEQKQKFIFIVGMPRSGGTLVEQIISCHPNIHSVGENGFIGDIVDDISTLLDKPSPYPNCLREADVPSLAAISHKILSLVESQGHSSEYIIDKSPVNFLHIGFIKILFPNSTIIYTQRNPIATCLSCYFQNFEKQHQYSYDLATLGEFFVQHQRLATHWKTLFSENFIEIEYEGLVSNQEDITRALITKCGFEWSNDYLDFHQSKNVISTASKWQTRQPIYQSSINKYQNYRVYIGELIAELEGVIECKKV